MNLIDLLPEYYKSNTTMDELQNILSKQINNLALSQNTIINQCFINTATELLSRYERIFGLNVDVSKSNEFRIERIKAKIAGTGTTTKQMIQDVARSYSNGEVEVIEDNENYKFTIKFIGTKGIPANMADLTLTIEEIKPAHLSYEFQYTYNTWGFIKESTWGQLKTKTWSRIKTYS